MCTNSATFCTGLMYLSSQQHSSFLRWLLACVQLTWSGNSWFCLKFHSSADFTSVLFSCKGFSVMTSDILFPPDFKPSSYICCYYLSLRSRSEWISHFPPHFSYLQSSRFLLDATLWGKDFAFSRGMLTGKAQLSQLILAAAEPMVWHSSHFSVWQILGLQGWN